MEIYWGMILGLASASSWGGGDFLAKLVIDRVGTRTTLFYVQMTGVALVGLSLLIFEPDIPYRPWGLAVALLSGSLAGTALICLYHAFAVGAVSVAAPVVTSFSLVTVILAISFLGERLTFLIALGIFLTVAGVASISVKYSELFSAKKRSLLPGVSWALLSALLFGTSSFLMKPVVMELGFALPALISKLCGALLVLLMSANPSKRPAGLVAFPFALLFAVGALDAGGILFFALGVSRELVSVVTPLAGIHAAVTVVLASFFLKEHLEINQKLGLISTLAGVFLLSVR